ncbi:hypothetical protein [Phenylobacterium sp.]|uniref:hypothetical protein n=1 Tax=Phenylobacterium sp. TaxID=1871053 RepID=UPI003563337D
MTASTASPNVHRLRPGTAQPFAPNHAWDRNFFLLYAGLIWFGILAGFGPEILKHAQGHAKPFPLIVHFHAAAFMGWLALFTGQILLIRTRRWTAHRTLGFAMIGLAAIMAVLGPATALIANHAKIGTPQYDPGFLSIQFTDIVAFLGLAGAAITFRNTAAIHKRLILLSTIYISDAGFGRWIYSLGMTGSDLPSFWGSLYLGPTLLVAGVGAYDLITRRRLHPAYLVGLVWIAAMQVTALSLYFSPAWKAAAGRLVALV